MKRFAMLIVLMCGFALRVQAEQLSYDISGSTGTRDGKPITEINVGLNYFPTEWFNWRNSLFTEFGSEVKTIYGLDSAALFNVDSYTSDRKFGVEFYAGPGVRLATEQSNAAFGKAGITFGLGGIRLGGGVQAFHYIEDRTDKNDNTLNKDEVTYFFTISGGGSI